MGDNTIRVRPSNAHLQADASAEDAAAMAIMAVPSKGGEKTAETTVATLWPHERPAVGGTDSFAASGRSALVRLVNAAMDQSLSQLRASRVSLQGASVRLMSCHDLSKRLLRVVATSVRSGI
jgi:hypothetical protein